MHCSAKNPYGEISHGIILTPKCPTVKCPTAKCPTGKSPRTVKQIRVDEAILVQPPRRPPVSRSYPLSLSTYTQYIHTNRSNSQDTSRSYHTSQTIPRSVRVSYPGIGLPQDKQPCHWPLMVTHLIHSSQTIIHYDLHHLHHITCTSSAVDLLERKEASLPSSRPNISGHLDTLSQWLSPAHDYA